MGDDMYHRSRNYKSRGAAETRMLKTSIYISSSVFAAAMQPPPWACMFNANQLLFRSFFVVRSFLRYYKDMERG